MVVGIDIGKEGGIAVLSETGNVLLVRKMPLIGRELDPQSLVEMIELAIGNSEAHIFFEAIGPIFGVSKSSFGQLMHQAGLIEGLCIAMKLPYTKVPPKLWQKHMFEGVPNMKKTGSTSNDTKNMAAVAAKRIFPMQKLSTERGQKPHSGMTDALLIAEYGRRSIRK